MSKVAAVIMKLRTSHGWSQSELARQAKLRQSHIFQLENGDLSNPSLVTLEKLAVAFGLTSHSLLQQINEAAAEPSKATAA